MTRDHMMGFPALASLIADEHPRPVRVTPHRPRFTAEQQEQRRAIDVRPPAAPAVGFAVGDVVRMTLRSASYRGRRATVLERSLSGTTMRVHFEGEATPDPGWYVVWAFERVAQ